jgi:predicted Zn-dependent protease
VESLVALARSYLALRRPEKAEQRLKEHLAGNPDNIVAINLLGEVYQAMGQTEKAREQYETAVAKAPGAPLAYARLARLQRANREPDAALETLRSGIEATQRNPLLVLTLAILQVQTGQSEDALATYEALLKDYPSTDTAATDLVKILDDNRFDDPASLLSIAVLQHQAGQYDTARAAYEEVLRRNPRADGAANNLAMLLADHRRDDPASLARARELAARFESSDHATFLDTAGWVQYRSGNFQQAADLLKKSLDLAEATPERQYHLGMAYLKVGRTEEGKRLLASAVEAGSPFQGIDEARAMLDSE